MGFRNGIRAGTELCALGIHTDESMAEFMGKAGAGEGRLRSALQERDEKFGGTPEIEPNDLAEIES